jgi:peptidoglycan/xylan/chitin deacetylase (PgdA/CDA1 family)/glycosyltransferase involved in cell wall biosynthesis
MQVSVIIATYNRHALLMQTLPLLLAQQFPIDQYEVVVVVDGSTDGTVDYLQSLSNHAHLRVVVQENRGQAAAINAGLRAVRGEIVLFLDDDILCKPTLVAEHANASRIGKQCLAFGPVLISEKPADALACDWAKTFCDHFFDSRVSEAPEKGWYGCMASANSSMPRELVRSIGYLDETFSRGNDVEFGFRLLDAGYTFAYLPQAITRQIFKKTRRDVIDDAAGEGIAEIRLCRKHPALRATSRFASFSFKPWWKRLLARVVTASPVSPEPLIRPIAWILSNLRVLPACRRMALRTLQTQQNIAAYRSAVKTAGSWPVLLQEFDPKLPILMYHHVGPQRDGFDEFLNISPATFERHLRWLAKNGFTTIHLSDWIAAQRQGKPLPQKPVVLTFDDGYRDTAEFGFPLLEKYGFKATLFLVTDQIGGTNLWDLPLGVSEQPLMSAQEVQHWSAHGIEVGSHTKSHPDLRSTSTEKIVAEMKESKERLEELLGAPVTAFAYPYGYLSGEAIETARKFYEAAVTCEFGLNRLGSDPLRLRRATVVPRYTWWDMPSYTSLGFNLSLIVRTKISSELHRLIEGFKGRPAKSHIVNVDHDARIIRKS